MATPVTDAEAPFAPDGQARAEAAFLDANPGFRATALLDELRATEYARLDATRRRLPRLHGRQPLRGLPARRAPAAARRDRLREPALGQPDVDRRDRARRAGAGRGPALLQRAGERVRVHLHAERDGRPAARRRGVSVRARRPLPRDCSTTTTRSTASASSPARRARRPRTSRSRRPTSGSPTGCSSATSTRRGPSGHNLFAYPAQSNFSGVKHPLEWIAHGAGARLGRDRGLGRVRADEPAGPVRLAAGLRPDLLLQDVRLPDRHRGAARAARGARAPASARGSAAAPSSRPTSRASWSCRSPATRCSRTGRSTTSASRRSRSGSRHIERIGIDTISRRVEGLGTWLLEALQELRHSDGSPATRIYGPDDLGPPRRDDLVQLPAPGRPRGRRALRRRRRRRPPDLRAHGLLLQLRRRRDRVLDLEGHADRRRVRRGHDPRRLHRADRHADGRRGARLARAGDELRRRLPLHALRDRVPRRDGDARRTCRRGSPARPGQLRRSRRAARAGAAPAAARPSGRGGSRRGRRASRAPRRGRAARRRPAGSTSISVRSRVVAVTGDGPPSISVSYPNACPGPARPTRMRRPPRTITFSTAPLIVR